MRRRMLIIAYGHSWGRSRAERGAGARAWPPSPIGDHERHWGSVGGFFSQAPDGHTVTQESWGVLPDRCSSYASVIVWRVRAGVEFWVGIVLGVCLVAVGTCGDLIESMIKRDLGIKDMSSFLPGHGGVMDRLDSLLVAAPVAWLIMYILVPG